jgi:dihydropteroate synthase
MTAAGAPTRLRLGARALRLDTATPLLMGIVNASPESFSDGGSLPNTDAQVEHGLRLVAEGAAIVDVGGESGVTDRAPISAEREIERVVPVVERLAAAGAAVSIDTWRAAVARAALAAGACMVNDVSGLREPGVAAACAEHGAALVVTHTRAAPKVKAFPPYRDVVGDVLELLAERLRAVERLGVAREQLVVDPGLDLAKTPAQSVEVLRRLNELRRLGRPTLLAVSRKDFVGALTARPPAARLPGTLAALAAGADAGASLVRVHDVAAASDFLTVRAAVAGSAQIDAGLRLAPELRRQRAEAA